MQKVFIQNRKEQKIAVVVEGEKNTKALAFVMHGLGGYKEQPQLLVCEEAFLEAGYTVVRFDTTNTFGESDGEYEKATVTNYYEDLEDVITWAQQQSWYQEPFVLLGHSLGGICTTLYTENFPEKVTALAPLATVVSGELSVQEKGEAAVEWKRTGWREEESISRPGTIRRLPWSHMEDRLQYNILTEAHKLTMPVLLVVGSKDTVTPLKHQKIFFDTLPGTKELHVIEGAQHTFRQEEHLDKLKSIVQDWLTKI
jgi:pimeloyl-ACP methyl ester carboxylesterase